MRLCCRDKSLAVFTRRDQLRGQIPLKYSYDANMQNLVRRSVGVVSNGSQIIAITQIYIFSEQRMLSRKLIGGRNSAVPRKKPNYSININILMIGYFSFRRRDLSQFIRSVFRNKP